MFNDHGGVVAKYFRKEFKLPSLRFSYYLQWVNRHIHPDRQQALAGAVFLLLASTSWANDWVFQQGVYPKHLPDHQWHALVQAQYVQYHAAPSQGLKGNLASFNGKESLFNQVAPNLTQSEQVQFNRAHLAMRGRAAEELHYSFGLEMGNNGITLSQDVVLTDASLSAQGLGHYWRFGRFKLPLGEEVLRPVHGSPFISYTNATDILLQERALQPHTPVAGRTSFVPMGAKAADLHGGVYGFHDQGVQLFQRYRLASWEHRYALMLSDGAGLTTADTSADYDVTLHWQSIFDGFDRVDELPATQLLKLTAWQQRGKRGFGASEQLRLRQGAGVHYVGQRWRTGVEWIEASGMIFLGNTPPFKDIGASVEPVYAVLDSDLAQARGGYWEVGYRLSPQWWLWGRLDQLDRFAANDHTRLWAFSKTLALSWQPSSHWQVGFNYEWRDMGIDFFTPSTSSNVVARDNMLQMLSSVDNRWALQASWRY